MIGRAPGSTIQLEDPTVSRSHARILSDRNGTPWVEDLGSSLGTVVDGAHIEQPVTLRDGSRLQIGAQTLRGRAPPRRVRGRPHDRRPARACP